GGRPFLDSLAQFRIHQPAHGRALASRKNQRIDAIQLLGGAHGDPLHLTRAEGRQMLAKVALQGEHPDASSGAHQPLPASSSSLGMAPISSPRIAFPKLLDTSTRMSGLS